MRFLLIRRDSNIEDRDCDVRGMGATGMAGIQAASRPSDGPSFDPPRPLTELERGLLSLVLSTSAPGSAELRAQLASARVVGECVCGCHSPGLVVDPASPPAAAPSPFPVQADATAADGSEVSVMLFLDGGRLALLEFVWYTDERGETPPLERWTLVER